MTKYDSANPVNAYIFFDTVDENGNPESQTLSPEIFYNEAPDLEVTDDTVRLIVFLSRVIGLAELREIHFGVSTPDGQPTPAEITLILEDGDEFDVSKSHPYNILVRHQSITYCLNHTLDALYSWAKLFGACFCSKICVLYSLVTDFAAHAVTAIIKN